MSVQLDFIKNKRAKQIAERDARDKKYGHLAEYKREEFPWEQPGYKATSTAPISQDVLTADPSIVTADNPRILTAEQVQSNIDVSDPLKRAANISKAQGFVDDAAAQRKLVNPDNPLEKNNTANLLNDRQNILDANKQDLDSKLVSANKQRAIDSLNAQFAKSSGRLDQEESAIAGNFRTAEGNVRTRDTLNRAGKSKFLDIGGLGQSGQVGQSAIAQNIATQGALGQLNQQELEQRADIERRRTELVAAREQGIADFETDAEIQRIESQLRSAEAQAEYDREKSTLAESREYDDYLRRVEFANDVQLLEEKNRLAQQNTILDAEIDDARANNDLVREIQLTNEKAVIDLQLEALRQSGRQQLESQQQAGRFGLENLRSANTQAEILARGEQDRLTDDAQNTNLTPNQTSINTSLKNYIGDTEFLSEDKIKERSLEWITRNEDVFLQDPQLLINIMQANNITNEELREYEEWRDRALNADVFQ